MAGPFRAAALTLTLTLLAACASGRTTPARPPVVTTAAPPLAVRTVLLRPSNVDSVLAPGDFLFRYANPNDSLSDSLTGSVIRGGQSVLEAVGEKVREGRRSYTREDDDGRLTRALQQGDANAVHLAIYLGRGETAEAFGTTLSDAGVKVWPLFAEARRGSSWRVFRHRNPALAAQVARVARAWATGRMGYRMPLELLARDASWGERARASARDFALAADYPGGPPAYADMFCSQFAVAVLQAAASRALLNSAIPTDAQLDTLPAEARLDALASPLRVYALWMQSGAFDLLEHAVVGE